MLANSEKKRKATDTIACSECRLRKTRCNRESPCDGCLNRGTPEQCKPDIRKYPPSLSKLSEGVDDLRARVHWLEQALARLESLPPNATTPSYQRTLSNEGLLEGSTGGPSDDSDRGEVANVLSGLAFARDFDILPESDVASQNPHPPIFDAQYPSILADSTVAQLARWQEELRLTILPQLPSMDVFREGAHLFIRYNSWQCQALSSHQLLAEMSEFQQLDMDGELTMVDPAWLALICQLLALAYNTAHLFDIATSFPAQEMALSCVALSEAALSAANWTTKASIRIIHTLILNSFWEQNQDPESGLFSQGSLTQRVRTAIVFTHCEALGLHQLGTSKTLMPKQDPGLPSHECAYRRQVGLRLWQDYRNMEVRNGFVLSKHSTSAQPELCRMEDYRISGEFTPYSAPIDNYELLFQELSRASPGPLRTTILAASNGVLSQGEILHFEAENERSLAEIEVHLALIPDSLPAPLYFGSKEGVRAALKMFRWSAALRVRRAAHGANVRSNIHGTNPSKSDTGKRQAALHLANLLTGDDAGTYLVAHTPVAILYLLNASIILVIVLCAEKSSAECSNLAHTVERAINTMVSHGGTSRNSAISQNSQRAIDSLFRLTRHLSRDAVAHHHTSESGPYLRALFQQLISNAQNPNAISLILEGLFPTSQQLHGTSLLAQRGSDPLLYDPQPFDTLSLLGDLDFDGWGNLDM